MKMKLSFLIAFCLGGWNALCAHGLDASTFRTDSFAKLSIVEDWDGEKACAVASKKGKKDRPKGGKKTSAKGKKGGKGKKRCVRVIRKNGRIIRVVPCPKSGRRPKSGR
jgi:hypothetical protein